MGSVSSEQGAQASAEKKHPLPLEIPVVAAGARPGDHAEKRELFTEETETVLVFEHGAVIHLAAAVAVGQLVFLTNKQTGKEIVTQVLRKRSYRPTACYVELDFTEAAPGFWGVEFPRVEADAKANLPESGEAALVAEAEITEEELGPTAPPDEAEITKLRQEVEALKSQLALPTPSEQQTAKHLSEMQQPSASELENLKSLLESKKSAEEPEEEAKQGRNGLENEPAKLEIMSPHEPKPEPVKSEAASQEDEKPAPDGEAEKSFSYPIRMQLPKAQGTSSRSSEFAADSAAITAAIDDHLLPKPSLDFEHFPGVKESKPKLFSGKARRSLSGPIGVLVVIVLLLVATGIGAYRLGWFNGSGRTNAETETKASVMPSSASPSSASPNTTAAKENPAGTAVVTGTERANEQPITESGGAKAESGESERLASTAVSETSAVAIKKSESHSNISASGSKKGSVTKAGPKDAPPVAPQEEVYVPPKLLKAIRSLSPPEALRAYVSGVVTLDAVVDENGRVTSATPVSGPKALYKKAEDTVKDYVYQPATKNGKPVSAHVEVKIQFWYEP